MWLTPFLLKYGQYIFVFSPFGQCFCYFASHFIFQMTIYPIETGNFKLDGGAMFGVVPKSIWNKTNPADSNNMIDLAARCLLIEDGDRLILIDNGLGNKQSEKRHRAEK